MSTEIDRQTIQDGTKMRRFILKHDLRYAQHGKGERSDTIYYGKGDGETWGYHIGLPEEITDLGVIFPDGHIVLAAWNRCYECDQCPVHFESMGRYLENIKELGEYSLYMIDGQDEHPELVKMPE